MRQRLADFDVLRVCLLIASVSAVPTVHAHGIAGNRYFPGTLTFDDPAVADELIVPNLSVARHPAGIDDAVDDTTLAVSFARLLTPDVAFGVDTGGTRWSRPGLRRQDGLGTTSLSFKALLHEDDPHEALVSASLGYGLPGSGSEAIGAGAPGSIQPGLFAGRGFGDLPDRLAWLRPFGVACGVTALLPTRRHSDVIGLDPATGRLRTIQADQPNVLHWGFALEYSTLYLSDRFNGGPPKEEPLNQLVPLVEFAFDSPFGGQLGYKTAGTLNPGISYVAVRFQIAAEAIVPLNRAAGSGVGGRLQLLFFLDDLIPSIFEKPLISERRLFAR